MKLQSLAAIAALCCTAAPAFAQNLSRVDVIGLQQQLRDDGCGVKHVTGTLDATTRRAVTKCDSKYNAAGAGPAALLNAMHIGFSSGTPAPSLSEARSGSAMSSGSMMKNDDSSMMGRRGRGMRRGNAGAAGRGMMMRDSTRMRRGMHKGMMRDSSMMHNGMRDSTMMRNRMHNGMRDSTMMGRDSMHRGMRRGMRNGMMRDSTMMRNHMMRDSTMMRNHMMRDSTMMRNHTMRDSSMTNPPTNPTNPMNPTTPTPQTTPPTPNS